MKRLFQRHQQIGDLTYLDNIDNESTFFRGDEDKDKKEEKVKPRENMVMSSN